MRILIGILAGITLTILYTHTAPAALRWAFSRGDN